MTFAATGYTGLHMSALQTRSDLISGSGYHHDLSRDDSEDEEFEAAGRSAMKVNNYNLAVPVSEFDFDNVNGRSKRSKILVQGITNGFDVESNTDFDRDVSIMGSTSRQPGELKGFMGGKSFLSPINGMKPGETSSEFGKTPGIGYFGKDNL